MDAWICPKCGRVWGPFVMACAPCNESHISSGTPTGLCPACKQPLSAPSTTGCPLGAHYGTYTAEGGR